ncbi:hypothetical protein [Gillisia sp. CAL575]|uniref:hypothetical protein n=1 Tax=Gillisia sp. CAL575 TaxID=985255 RepID=UPI0003A2D398|nr:hypothetical protein [Gillisia sp. CAL575]
MEKTKVIIIGGKGTAINIAEGILDAEKRFGKNIECIGFAFDDESFGSVINGFPVLCKTKEILAKFGKYQDVKFIFQMNHQDKMVERALLVDSYNIPKEKWYTFIHPSAFVANSAKIGYGSVVFANCAIHSNSVIGNHCTISALSSIGHDTVLGNHVFMATHVCIGSSVNIHNNVFFGQNSTVTGSVNISENNIIGLCAGVTNNLMESDKIYIGTPAKVLKSIN